MRRSGVRSWLGVASTIVLILSVTSACTSKQKWRSACNSQNQQQLLEELLAVGRALSVEWKPVVSCDADDKALFVENEPARGAPPQAVADKMTRALTVRGWTLQHTTNASASVADVEATVACLERNAQGDREFAQLFASSPTVVRMVHPADPKAEYCLH